MSSVIRKEMYVKSDVVNNNNKFWEIEIDNTGTCKMRWGRVGDSGQSQIKNFGSISEAEKFADGKIKEKCRDGRNGEIAYRKIDVVGGVNSVTTNSQTSQPINNSNLSQIAAKQIKTNNPIVDDLVKYLTKVNAHQICSASGGKITFSDTTGLFSTPIGIVTQDNIDQARDILAKIADIVSVKDYSNKNLISYTNDLLMLVPQNIGRQQLVMADFWSDQSKLQYQNGILDGLATSYANAISSKTLNKKDSKDTNSQEEKVFDVQMNFIEDRKLMKEIFDYYNLTKSSMHGSSRYVPKQMWSVDITHMKKAFETSGSKVGCIINGWHGTGSENVLSLLKSGFLVKPPKSAYIAGKLFGLGTYAAPTRRITGALVKGCGSKALAYAVGSWGGSNSSRKFMFFVEMAMGKFYTPSSKNYQSISYPVNGYDSTWAFGETMNGRDNNSGVMNDEAIVYKENQINIKYLVEFE